MNACTGELLKQLVKDLFFSLFSTCLHRQTLSNFFLNFQF